MNMRTLAPVLIFAGVLTVVAGSSLFQIANAQEGPPPPGQRERGPGGPPGGPGGEMSASRSMKGMGRALKGLKTQIADATKKSDCLRLVNEFQRGIINAKGAEVPADLLEGASDVERTRKAALYREQLIAALRLAIDLEVDIIEGRTDAAGAKIDSLATLRDDAHDKIGLKEE